MTAPHAQAEVLIVDDSMVVRQLLSGIVAAQGYRVCQAADGMEAMALLADGSRHVMLLDYSMPGMSGWDVLRELVAEQRFAQHAYIVMTADWAALPAAFTDFLARHAIPLLIKPIRTGDLLTVLDDAYHRLVGA